MEQTYEINVARALSLAAVVRPMICTWATRTRISRTTAGWKNLNKNLVPGFPGGAVVESLPANAGDTGSSPGLGRSHMPRSD